MISVEAALAQVLALCPAPEAEEVPLAQAAGRVLLAPAIATRDQPPFAASAMDGYALRGAEAQPGARFTVIGEAAAGHGFDGSVGPGEAVRIFTGAPVPEGADRVIIQEDTERSSDIITLSEGLDAGPHIRPKAADFARGDSVAAPRRLNPSDLALLASMNLPQLTLARRPVVALIATGDELVMPGETPGPDQIIASNSFGLKALLEAEGAEVRMLPIARDNAASLTTCFGLAADADLIVTIGGASVGDHDIVGAVAAELGMERSFYKIAMRPGKPLMAGRLNGVPMIGLPGNPVSSMVCGHIFLRPAIRAMLGLPAGPLPRQRAPLAAGIGPNGPREHYMRARVEAGQITVFDRQDSALLSVLAEANALAIRPIGDGAREPGEVIEYIAL